MKRALALVFAAAAAACTQQESTLADAGGLDAGSGLDVRDAGDSGRADAQPQDGSDASADAGDTGLPVADAGPAEDVGAADTGPSRTDCVGSSALFCEDFEGLAAGPAISARWNNSEGNGSLTVDGQQARGSQALHVHTEGNGWAFIRLPFTPPDNSFYVRMYLWVTEFPSAPNWAHYTLIEATGNGAGFIRPLGGQYVPPQNGGGSFWGIGSDGGPTGDWTDWRTSAPSEAGRWLCIEAHLDASDNRIELAIGGVINPDLTVSTSRHGGNNVDFVFPDFDRISIGWQLYQGGPTPSSFDLWIDDLVLDDQSPGCP